MTSAEQSPLPADRLSLPEPWRSTIAAQLLPGESPVVHFETDLDPALHFQPGCIVLTQRQLLFQQGNQEWQRWELRPGLVLKHRHHGSVSALEFCDSESRLACWNHTAARDEVVRRLTDQFREHVQALAEKRAVVPPAPAICPICESPIPEGQESLIVRVTFGLDREVHVIQIRHQRAQAMHLLFGNRRVLHRKPLVGGPRLGNEGIDAAHDATHPAPRSRVFHHDFSHRSREVPNRDEIVIGFRRS